MSPAKKSIKQYRHHVEGERGLFQVLRTKNQHCTLDLIVLWLGLSSLPPFFMKKLIQRRPQIEDTHLPAALSPKLRQILASRGVGADELDFGLQKLPNYKQLAGMEGALDLLSQHVQAGSSMVVVADFDADGATSCALMLRMLKKMGVADISYVVPDRQKHGYGLTPVVAELAADTQAQLLITVDNGVAAHAGVEAAQALGMQVLVTDHHLPGEDLPAAEAILNPNIDPSPDAVGKSLAGVGVAFFLMIGLRAQLRDLGWFQQQQIPEPNLAEVLDLVALGTVADLVPLDYSNRILVAQGLMRMRQGYACFGIQALIGVANKNSDFLVSTDLGFQIGPRLNAAGRMEDMRHGIDCLLADSIDSANEYAAYLDRCNRERRAVETDIQEDAFAQLSQTLAETEDLPLGLCLYDDNWHPGVLGIVASRIKAEFHRPTVILTQDSVNPDNLKGSARSIAGVHIRDVLVEIDNQQPGLLNQFGGHAMAAGLSLPAEHLEAFKQAFADKVDACLGGTWQADVILTDGDLEADELGIHFAEQLRYLSPWGQQFPEPVFDGRFRLLQHRALSDGLHQKLLVQVEGGHYPLDAICFNTPMPEWLAEGDDLQLAYRLDINYFRGQASPQLIVLQMSET